MPVVIDVLERRQSLGQYGQRGSLVAVLTSYTVSTYNAATDVVRQRQATIFGPPAPAWFPPKLSPLVTNGVASTPVAALNQYVQSLVFNKDSSWGQGQKPNVLTTLLSSRESSDIFYSQDVQGWPLIPEERFIQAQANIASRFANRASIWVSSGGITFTGTASAHKRLPAISTGGIAFGGGAIFQSLGQTTAGKTRGRRRLFNLLKHNQ